MTRLRYSGLATGSAGALTALSLSGSLTNSATSVTFSAALTYANGTAVPTLVSPDYIPLSILDSTGQLSEVVYLTAYTAAATTGTITRGAEGTTGVTHASGDRIVHAPTATDITGTAPTYVGSVSAYSSSASFLNLTVPAGTLAGDTMIGFCSGSWDYSDVSGGASADMPDTVGNPKWFTLQSKIGGTNVNGGLAIARATGSSAGSTVRLAMTNTDMEAGLIVVRGVGSIVGSAGRQDGTTNTAYMVSGVLPHGNELDVMVVAFTGIRTGGRTLSSANLANQPISRTADTNHSLGGFYGRIPDGHMGFSVTASAASSNFTAAVALRGVTT